MVKRNEKAEMVKCPACHKNVKKTGLNAHMRLVHPSQPPIIATPDNLMASVLTPSLTEETVVSEASPLAEDERVELEPESENWHPLMDETEPVIEEPGASELLGAVQQLVNLVNQQRERVDQLAKDQNDLVRQLPNIINTSLRGQLDQMATEAQGSQTVAVTPPTEASAPNPLAALLNNPQVTSTLLEGVLKKLIGSDNPTNPAEALTKQIEGLAGIARAFDDIRGKDSSGNFSAKNAIDWMKFGWQQGKSGMPQPDYPEATSKVAPSENMGGQS